MNKKTNKTTNKITSKIILLLLLLLFNICILNNKSYADGIRIFIDNEPVNFTEDSGMPFIDEHYRTLVPLRVTMETFGATVDWDNKNKIASVMMNDTIVYVPMNTNFIYVNNEIVTIDTVSVVYNNRIYLPIRFVLEAFDAKVEWNSELYSVIIYHFDYDNDESNEEVDDREEIDEDDIKEKIIDKCVLIKAQKFNGKMYASGSGFFISNDGYIVTNRHVIDNSCYITVEMNSGKEYTNVTIVDEVQAFDLALLKINTSKNNFEYFDIDYKTLCNKYETCYSISSPGGDKNRIIEGEILGLDFEYNDNLYLLLDIDIDHGSSGGVLLNKYGEVIGVTNAIIEYSNGDRYELAVPVFYLNSLDDTCENDEGYVALSYTYIENLKYDILDFEAFTCCDLLSDEEIDKTYILEYDYSDFQGISERNITTSMNRITSVLYYEEALKTLGYEKISTLGDDILNIKSNYINIDDVFANDTLQFEIILNSINRELIIKVTLL